MIRFKLHELLHARGMTQKQLVEKTGIRAATICKMYYGDNKRIEIDQLDRICRELGCGIGDLLEYEEE